MIEAPAYAIWEVGLDQAAPEQLADLMTEGERLLWSATLPSNRLQRRRLLGGVVCLGLAIWMFFLAPWGQDMAEYCANSKGSPCEGNFLLAWPLAGFGALFAVHLLSLVWKSRFAPWQDIYGVSTKRAIVIPGHKKAGKVYSARLDQYTAGIDWFGSVRFGGTRTGLPFAALDNRDAKRAVYWANAGGAWAEDRGDDCVSDR